MDMSTKVSERNPIHIPMVDTDYFAWLKGKKKPDIHAIDTKKEYLSDRFGFVFMEDKIDGSVISTLKCIEGFYFDFYVKKPKRGLY